MTDLWATRRTEERRRVEPLAVRMRPRTLDEFVGQEHILGEGRLLRRMIDARRLTSLVLSGPPGTGKTSLAEIIACHLGCHVEVANAARVGVRDIRRYLDEALRRLEEQQQRTILFLDEIHRFARNQQDVLLENVERGWIILIGATTQNPTYSINSSLLSRSNLFRLEPLDEADISVLLDRALRDERGYGNRTITIRPGVLEHWATRCDGDARRALNALEIAVLSQDVTRPADTEIEIDLACAEDSLSVKCLAWDRQGDDHFDTISAFIKSMRGGDDVGTLYWLALMLEAGEDPRYIARRIGVFASEDIGNADAGAVQIADAAWNLVDRIGLPECRLTLAQAAVYMARAPKDREIPDMLQDTRRALKEERRVPVPKQLQNRHADTSHHDSLEETEV